MAVEVLAPIAEALGAVIAWIAEVFMMLLRSCLRSLRFAFSPSFRQPERERLKGRGQVYRAVHACWGVVAVVSCFGLVGGLVYWLARPQPTPAEACAERTPAR